MGSARVCLYPAHMMAGSRLRNPDADIILDENEDDQFEPLEP